MKLLFALVIGGLGFSFWRKRRQAVPPEAASPESAAEEADPAAELRAKLAETKSEATPGTADEDGSTPELPKSPFDPELRRRDVHERARAELDELG